MDVNEYFKLARNKFGFSPRAVCADGFSVSIQASYGHYCTPRQMECLGGYTAVELGYPSRWDAVTCSLLKDYSHDVDAENETVFGYVPVEIVNQLLEAHGGIKWVSLHQNQLVEVRFYPLIAEESRERENW